MNVQKKLYDAYQTGGASAVYDLANKLKLPYSPCKPCDAETPTIKHVTSVCGVCGTVKQSDNVQKTLQLILKKSVTSSMFGVTFPKGKILNVTLMNNRIYVHYPKNENCLIAVTKTNIKKANFKFKGVIDTTILCDLNEIAKRDKAIVKNEVSKLVRLNNVHKLK
jgi:hypothetical protein